jgi:hypothetical protein
MNLLCKSLSKLVIVVVLIASISSLQLTAILKAREEMKQVLSGKTDISKDVKGLKKNERILSLVHGTAQSLNEQMGKQRPTPAARNLTPAKPRFLTQTKALKSKKEEKKTKVGRKAVDVKKNIDKKIQKKDKKSSAYSPRFLKQVADKDSIVVHYEPAKSKKKDSPKKKGGDIFKKSEGARNLKLLKDDYKTQSKKDRKLNHGSKSAKKHHKKAHKKSHKKAHKKAHKKVHKKAHKKAHKSRNLKEKKERNLLQLPSVNEFLGSQMKQYNRGGY